MSHIAKIKANIELKEQYLLKNALNNLTVIYPNINIKENENILRAISSNELEKAELVDYLVDLNNGFQIGLKKTGNKYELVADEWYWEINHKKNLLNKLTNQIQDFYLLEEVKRNAEEEGYNVNWVYNQENEEIEIEMEKW